LAVEYVKRPALLFYYMSAQMVDFTADVAERGLLADAEHLYPRFINWIRPATRTAEAA
jgi:hypothetical protein